VTEPSPPNLDDLPVGDALTAIGLMIDSAADAGDLAIVDRALACADALEARGLEGPDQAVLDYFRANAWAVRYHPRTKDKDAVWAWDQPELQAEIFHLRRARNSPGFGKLNPQRRCQILTNLANCLDTLGRFVESRSAWTEALAIIPEFWMARGNRAAGLLHYARALYDPRLATLFALRAHEDFVRALADIEKVPEFDDPAHGVRFKRLADWIAGKMDVEAAAEGLDLEAGDLGPDAAYRRWALREVLFLDPLNDLEPCVAAAQDSMTLPDFTTGLEEGPVVVGFFNQLKQEYVSARWLLFEALQRDDTVHPSDREVTMFNTLDYPSLGLATEKLKLSYRMAYSIFDKIAYFLNHYLALGIPETKVSFRSVWRDKAAVRAPFEGAQNLTFRGLYWLSKDLYEPGEHGVAAPDAEDLHVLRNHLEHKYVKVVEMGPFPRDPDAPRDGWHDDLAYVIGRRDLEAKSLRILKLARGALIYLALGMHAEERRRADARPKDNLVMPMPLDRWEDDWKV